MDPLGIAGARDGRSRGGVIRLHDDDNDDDDDDDDD
jgi:hypothetical protein